MVFLSVSVLEYKMPPPAKLVPLPPLSRLAAIVLPVIVAGLPLKMPPPSAAPVPVARLPEMVLSITVRERAAASL